MRCKITEATDIKKKGLYSSDGFIQNKTFYFYETPLKKIFIVFSK